MDRKSRKRDLISLFINILAISKLKSITRGSSVLGGLGGSSFMGLGRSSFIGLGKSSVSSSLSDLLIRGKCHVWRHKNTSIIHLFLRGFLSNFSSHPSFLDVFFITSHMTLSSASQNVYFIQCVEFNRPPTLSISAPLLQCSNPEMIKKAIKKLQNIWARKTKYIARDVQAFYFDGSCKRRRLKGLKMVI